MARLPEKAKRAIIVTVRTGIGAALAGTLVYFTITSTQTDLRKELASANHLLLLLALALLMAVSLISFARWRLLLRVQGIHLGFWPVTRLGMIGAFFNLVIPGAVSGDLLKMAYIMRQAPSHKAEAVLSIMFDRFLGLLGLFIVASSLVLACLPMVLGMQESGIRNAVLLVGLGGFGGITAVVLIEVREALVRHPWVAATVAAAARRLPHRLVEALARLIEALELYRRNRGTVCVALAMSVAIHGLLGLQLFCIGRSLHEHNLRMRDYFLATQVGNAVGAIPVTPGGVGTRDFTAKTFLRAAGATPEKIGAIPVTLSLMIVAIALIGAAVFALSPVPVPDPTATAPPGSARDA